MKKNKEIICKSACTKTKCSMPYKWDLSIYRGCEHRCKYCYAVYSHKYLESNYRKTISLNEANSKNFFNNIYIKTNIAEELDKQLSKSSWKNEMIAIGTVTDSYQPIEKEHGLMREVLEVLIKHKNPAIISTKSDIILRDLDLIEKLSELNFINIATTITSLDLKIQKAIEPNAISSKKRLDVLKKVRNQTKASTGVHFMPIIPYISDNYKHIDAIFKNAEKRNIHTLIFGSLNLYGETKKIFLKFIKKDFPEFYAEIYRIYKNGRVDRNYSKELFTKINKIKTNYHINTNYRKIIKEKLVDYRKKENLKQTTLFDY
ncbi:SPL family radical SAM protein [Methanobrevibacter curvatus]|uniref:Radical SAM superfamily protein n=1 Tax=Methanobrevibacter curvatus TaxID=49547 RepID=A0A162FHP0_9EURY|nr:radical SAM protein [Methanobrevibacter curvatus]KZX10100.1 radical SAM superfamily protein [Methanobrevibacter curvatus]